METISYAEMLSLWERGLKTGAIRRLPCLKKGLLSAALTYARMKGHIMNRKLIEMIRGVADQIRNTIGRRIFSWGIQRAFNILRNAKAMEIFPSLRKWLDHDPYVFWLGTDLLVKMRRWIWV